MSDSAPLSPNSELGTASTSAKGSLEQNARQLCLQQIERHVFLCADQREPKCCSKALGLQAWTYLKQRLKELGLDSPHSNPTGTCIFRTKANCLRVCAEGPILLVYPDGVWYRRATPKTIERIIQEHLLGDRIVEEYVFCVRPLPRPQLTLETRVPDPPFDSRASRRET
ncbi:MAG: ferredoxin [Cyanobacteriota bacterium]|nr:ferredoxin [Cyanobacteriota bacterium]